MNNNKWVLTGGSKCVENQHITVDVCLLGKTDDAWDEKVHPSVMTPHTPNPQSLITNKV